jgi:hypothetical protein
MADAVARTCATLPGGDLPDHAIERELMGYFVTAAEHLRNDTGLPITPAGYRDR